MEALQIVFEGGLEPSDSLRARIEREAEKLERLRDRIVSCRVAVSGRSGRRRHGDLYSVRLQISVPGQKDIVIDRNPPEDHAHEDAFVAIRDAFRAARRRLQDSYLRQQGQVKAHEAPLHGKITKLIAEGEYGFIEADDGREIYFHGNAIQNGRFEDVRVLMPVRFHETPTDQGPQASSIHLLKG